MGIIRRDTSNGVKWEVYIDRNNKRVHMGRFDNQRHAQLIELMWKPEKGSRSQYFTSEQIEKAAENGIDYPSLYRRVVKRNWDIETAINTPARKIRSYKKTTSDLRLSPIYDRVMNYLIKHHVKTKQNLQRLFPEADPKIVDAVWNNAKEIGIC